MKGVRLASAFLLIIFCAAGLSCSSQEGAVGPGSETIVPDLPGDGDASPFFTPSSGESGDGGGTIPTDPGKGKSPDARAAAVEIVSAPGSVVPVEEGKDFELQLTAKGGSGAYEWESKGEPPGFRLDAQNKNAVLKGKSKVPGSHEVTVAVVDKEDRSNKASVLFSLKVGKVVAKHAGAIAPNMAVPIQAALPCNRELKLVIDEAASHAITFDATDKSRAAVMLGKTGVTIGFKVVSADGSFDPNIVAPFRLKVESELKDSCHEECLEPMACPELLRPVCAPRKRDSESVSRSEFYYPCGQTSREDRFLQYKLLDAEQCESSGKPGNLWTGVTRNATWHLKGDTTPLITQKPRSAEGWKMVPLPEPMQLGSPSFTLEGNVVYDGVIPVDRYVTDAGLDDMSRLPVETLNVTVWDECAWQNARQPLQARIDIYVYYPEEPVESLTYEVRYDYGSRPVERTANIEMDLIAVRFDERSMASMSANLPEERSGKVVRGRFSQSNTFQKGDAIPEAFEAKIKIFGDRDNNPPLAFTAPLNLEAIKLMSNSWYAVLDDRDDNSSDVAEDYTSCENQGIGEYLCYCGAGVDRVCADEDMSFYWTKVVERSSNALTTKGNSDNYIFRRRPLPTYFEFTPVQGYEVKGSSGNVDLPAGTINYQAK